MELRQLRYFVALAEAQNFHRAAAQLNISQPPLTVAIRKLEAELGERLFDRGTRGVTLTACGAVALDSARATLAQATRFRVAVREGASGERGRLRVGFVGSATFDLLPRIIPVYRRLYPFVELALEEATSIEIARRLAAGDLDVGLIRLPLLEIAEIDATIVDRDEFHVAVPTTSRFARMSRVALEDLSQEAFVLQSRVSVLHAITLMACHEAGFVPRVAQEAAQLSAMLSLVRSGLGVALVPARAASAVPQGVSLIALSHRVQIETGVALPRHGTVPVSENFARVATELDSY